MIKTLFQLLRLGRATQDDLFPDLPSYARGLPAVTAHACTRCEACVGACPTRAVGLEEEGVRVDLGRCLACAECVRACPTGTLVEDRSTRTSVLRREDLVRGAGARLPDGAGTAAACAPIFRRSIHLREVSTGDNAADLEVNNTGNPVFDHGRFGIHVVASPRFADALVVTGPVGLAMQEPLRRCYDAMAEPRMVIAAGAAAISGVPWDGGYAAANGTDGIVPVTVYVPGHPPHPWSLLHGILRAMGSPLASPPLASPSP